MCKNKTHEQFIKEVFKEVGNEYTILGQYLNSKTKIEIKHNKCGYTFNMQPHNFIDLSQRCPRCAANARKTNKQFLQEVYQLVGNEYTFLEAYVTNNTLIKVKHNKCGHIYKVRPSNFLSGKRCPKCAGCIKKTTKQFKQEIYDLYKGEYEVLGEYKNTHTKIMIRHNKCGYEYLSTPTNLLRGHGCIKCGGNSKKNTEEIKSEIHKLVGDEYTLLNEYKDAHTKLKLQHNSFNCGNYIWETTISTLRKGVRCPKCAGNVKKNTTIFKEEVSSKYGNEYEVLSEYKNSNTKILIKHNLCGHTWKARPSTLLRGCGCPKCVESKGEKKISQWLDDNNISYIPQFKFPNCKFKKELPFDFYLDDINMCIEYDGEGHYKPFRFNKNKQKNLDKLKIVQKRDNIKDIFCKENNIRLIRIPYTKFNNIEEILKSII